MGPSGSHFELIYHDDMTYEDWIDSRFIFMHKGVLVINYAMLHKGSMVNKFSKLD